MSVTPIPFSYGLALGLLTAAGTRFLYTTTLSTWPTWTRTLFGWALLVGGMAAVARLAHGLGILKGKTLNDALADDRHHVLFRAFIALTFGFWFLSIGVGIYADSAPANNVNAWRVFVLFIGSLFVTGSTRHPAWLYHRLRHSDGNELLKDVQSTRVIFAALGAGLAIYALAAPGG